MEVISTKRQGEWFLTFTGKKFYPTDPRPEDFCIEDIAHALSNLCRFGGHVKQFYSVAQHSLIVEYIVKKQIAGPSIPFQALLHDGTEFAVQDLVRPLKVQLPQYKDVELKVWRALCERYDIPEEMHPLVKDADNIALLTERRDLLPVLGDRWSLEEFYKPLVDTIDPMPPEEAEQKFLAAFNVYGKR